MIVDPKFERYIRQTVLPDFGMEAQLKLSKSKVLVIGAGGLGNPVIQYLAAAGIGLIGIADGDTVEESNLQRQVIFEMKDIGLQKAALASDKISRFNPQVVCKVIPHHVSNANAFAIFESYDVIVDCTDNFAARYAIGDACYLLKKPLVFGAVFQYEGQVAVFNCENEADPVSYRDLFPVPPDPASVPDCNRAGVLGVLPGIIGTMQAAEVIKIISGVGELLNNKILHYDLRTHETMVIQVSRLASAKTHQPADRTAYEQLDYDWICGLENGIKRSDLERLLQEGNTIAIDVRELNEIPHAPFAHIRLPLTDLGEWMGKPDCKNIVVFCQSGIRSAKAVSLLKQKLGIAVSISQLKGGLNAYYHE